MRPNGLDQNNRLGNEMQLILKIWVNWCIISQLSCVLLMYFFQQDIIVKVTVDAPLFWILTILVPPFLGAIWFCYFSSLVISMFSLPHLFFTDTKKYVLNKCMRHAVHDMHDWILDVTNPSLKKKPLQLSQPLMCLLRPPRWQTKTNPNRCGHTRINCALILASI